MGTIKKYAICASIKLRSIDLNQTVQMEESAIDDCPNLTTVKISANMTNLAGGITGCNAIEYYYVDDANDNFCAIDGIVYSKDSTILYLFPPARTSYTFPADTKVKEFGYRSFMGSKLTSLTVPAIVEQIDSVNVANFMNNHSYDPDGFSLKMPMWDVPPGEYKLSFAEVAIDGQVYLSDEVGTVVVEDSYEGK